MALFGSGLGLPQAFSQLMDTRSEEEKQRAEAQFLPQSQGGGWGDGLRDLSTALMAAQASIDGDFSTAASLGAAQQQRMAAAMRQAQEANMRARRAAALARSGKISPEDADLLAGDDVAFREALMPKEPGNEYEYFDDNAGNRWRLNKRSGQVDPNPAFVDKSQRTIIGANGQMVTIPNPYLNQDGGAPNSPVGRLTPIPGGGVGNGAGTFRTDIPSGNPLEPWPPRGRR